MKNNSKGLEKVGKGGNSIEGMFYEELRYFGERYWRIYEWWKRGNCVVKIVV